MGGFIASGKKLLYPVFLDIPSVPSQPRLSVGKEKNIRARPGVVASKSESNWSSARETGRNEKRSVSRVTATENWKMSLNEKSLLRVTIRAKIRTVRRRLDRT